MTTGRFLRQKVVGVEHFGIGENFFVAVNFERGDDDGGTDW